MNDPILLRDRVVLRVTGEDASSFLEGLITSSIVNLQAGEAGYGALLMPQGKIICDMIVLKRDDGFLLDVPAQADESLFKRLKMFRLKSKVDIELADNLHVYVNVEDGFADPRSPDMPKRIITTQMDWELASERHYHLKRIQACVPEQGYDFGENEVFPSDINMDLLNGVNFKKGCFVGQEVVSRMKRRGTTRRRTLAFRFEQGAPAPASALMANDVQVGEISSVQDEYALARVRLDRLIKAQEETDLKLTAENRDADLIEHDWLAEQIAILQS